MSLIPAFEIGVWNAWVFMLGSLIPVFFMPLIARGREEEASFTAHFSKMQKNALLSLHIIYFLLVIYSIFVPLKLGTVWFYVGLPIFLLGLVPYIMVSVNFVTTPIDKPVTKASDVSQSVSDIHGGGHSFGFLGFLIAFGCIYNHAVFVRGCRRTLLP